MPWNWQLPEWPKFIYDLEGISQKERQFLLEGGSSFAFLKTIELNEMRQFIVEILSAEGIESSRIEGEILDRESLQSSIKQQFGLPSKVKKSGDRESRMAKLLMSAYESFDEPLTDEMLWGWHSLLLDGSSHISDCGKYRTHREPMQIISNRYDSPHVFFEAVPSERVADEMRAFIEWFNGSRVAGSILERAAIAHVYFESIHPFEDGNGRIGRVLVEKALSQGMKRPVLIAISKVLEKRKKEYYAALGDCNRTLNVRQWVEFFCSAILQAQKESLDQLFFLIEKSKMLNALSDQINPRQMKALLRMFGEGPQGFVGGMSAEKYIAITKASRATATRDLNDLVEKGALIKVGELRHTRYGLNLNSQFPSE